MLALFAQPVVDAALVTGGVAITTLIVNARLNQALHRQRLSFDLRLAQARADQELHLAEQKAAIERRESIWRRKADYAEILLAECNDFVERLRAVREPGAAIVSDPTIQPFGLTYSNAESIKQEAFQKNLRRLQKETPFIETFLSKRFRARALFGDGVDVVFKTAAEIVADVRGALEDLVKPRDATTGTLSSLINDWSFLVSQNRPIVWSEASVLMPDKIDARLVEVRQTAETLFSTYLLTGLEGWHQAEAGT